MPREQFADQFDIVRLLERFEIHELEIAAPSESTVAVQDERHPAAHARRKVPARLAKHDDAPARHVLAAVIANPLDHRKGTAVANGETLSGHPADVGFAARRAIQRHVADDDVLLRQEGRLARRVRDELPAGQSLADVIVCIAFEHQRDPTWDERTITLAGRTRALDADRVVRQALSAPSPRHFVAEPRSDCAMDVADRTHEGDGPAMFERLAGGRDEIVVERGLEPMRLRRQAPAWRVGWKARR